MSDELTASLQCLTCSPAPPPPPLEDDDLLAGILLRLPPLPSSLPRASAVSRRWRSIASDTRFCSRFRAHHRRNPPLLGYFVENKGSLRFQPALEAPNRIPQGHFSFPMEASKRPLHLGCRHGLVLSLHKKQLLVWDPVIGDQHLLDNPPEFDMKELSINAAVFRAAGDVRDFQVVLVGTSDMHLNQLVASVYSSKTDTWGNLITMPAPPADSAGYVPMDVSPEIPAVMVGDSLYWLIGLYSLAILKFDVGRRSLSVIPMPGEVIVTDDMDLGNISVITPEDGGIGFLLLSGFDAQLWKRTTNCDGVASWALQRTIALDKLLSVNPEEDTEYPYIIGFAENNNVVILWTSIGVFTVQLQSLQFKKLIESNKYWEIHYPFECVYTTDKGIDYGHDGAETSAK